MNTNLATPSAVAIVIDWHRGINTFMHNEKLLYNKNCKSN